MIFLFWEWCIAYAVMPCSLLVVYVADCWWAILVIHSNAYWATFPTGGLHGILAGFMAYWHVAYHTASNLYQTKKIHFFTDNILPLSHARLHYSLS